MGETVSAARGLDDADGMGLREVLDDAETLLRALLFGRSAVGTSARAADREPAGGMAGCVPDRRWTCALRAHRHEKPAMGETVSAAHGLDDADGMGLRKVLGDAETLLQALLFGRSAVGTSHRSIKKAGS